MAHGYRSTSLVMMLALAAHAPAAAEPSASPETDPDPILVTPDNFVRAETDTYFAGVVANRGFGRFDHTREPAPLDKQTVIRLNRDTLYSAAVFDLDAGPVTITLPESGERFMSLQILDQDHYTHGVHYQAGDYTLSRGDIGTRYVVAAVRTLADPGDPAELDAAHALQDAIEVEQEGEGSFEVPAWDAASQKKVRDALLVLASTLPDTRGMYGSREEVDPVRFLIGAAQGWGANPADEALYLNVVPDRNDGRTVYTLTVGEVPVDGFWSISVYNAAGYFEPNRHDAYSVNDITGSKNEDGSVTVQFGGCDGQVPNCLPTMEGWNYMVRLYRPRPEITSGEWSFPRAEPVR